MFLQTVLAFFYKATGPVPPLAEPLKVYRFEANPWTGRYEEREVS